MVDPLVGMHPGASAGEVVSSKVYPQRKNIRAEFHDYSGGDYFVTICTHDREHYFGEITDGEVQFTEIGRYADYALSTLASHYKYVDVPLHVVMPSHIHAIISIFGPIDGLGCIPAKRTALSVVVAGLKQSVTCYARRNRIDFGWQKRYHDHIIRGTRDGNHIAEYIENNVVRWGEDCYNK